MFTLSLVLCLFGVTLATPIRHEHYFPPLSTIPPLPPFTIDPITYETIDPPRTYPPRTYPPTTDPPTDPPGYEDGWYLAGDFAYKLTVGQHSWWAGRMACQAMGGDIAVNGVRNNAIRWQVAQELYVGPVWIGLWVGLDGLETDMKWKWTDGQDAKDEDIVWSPSEPNGDTRENCGEMWGEARRFTMNDNPCCDKRYALCEKKIES
ncbi:unnamed protein product [Clavelina lepadiformis]|uniref:C-type lectin domain-containing protein n=1 Tax=Clavelina lepadiformis TaxID=159417 RepID=A0ABP0H7P1_CLALP